jgi:hypothetical protein
VADFQSFVYFVEVIAHSSVGSAKQRGDLLVSEPLFQAGGDFSFLKWSEPFHFSFSPLPACDSSKTIIAISFPVHKSPDSSHTNSYSSCHVLGYLFLIFSNFSFVLQTIANFFLLCSEFVKGILVSFSIFLFSLIYLW